MGIELVLIGICGLIFVVIGALVVAAFVIARSTGKSLFELFGGLGGAVAAIGGGDDDDDVAPSDPRLRRSRRQRPDLRAQADSLDFDTAVSQYQQGQPPPSASSAPPPSTALPPWENTQPTEPPPSVRRSRRRRRNDDEGDLDMLEGFMDDDSPL